MQPRLFKVSSFGTRSSLSSNLPAGGNIRNISKHCTEAVLVNLGSPYTLTSQKETREGDHVKLLHCDIIAVHKKVQQVDSQVSGCRTQPEVVADDGYEVCKVSSQVELRGLAFEGRQLKLLLDNTLYLTKDLCSYTCILFTVV